MKEPVGRRLDFLIQELNREINTVGSKANDLLIAQIVINFQGWIGENTRTNSEYWIVVHVNFLSNKKISSQKYIVIFLLLVTRVEI